MLFIAEVLNVLAVLDLLLEIVRHRLGVELSQEGESLKLFLNLSRSILTHIVMNHQRDHSDLVGVVLRPASLEGEAD